MTISLYRTAWGLVGPKLTWSELDEFSRDAAAESYDGVEFPLFYMDAGAGGRDATEGRVRDALAETGLNYIPLIATRPAQWGDREAHFDDFRDQIIQARKMGATRVAAHAGADSFAPEVAIAFLRDCHNLASDAGIDACFETHRGRPLNDPWRTRDALEALPDLRLTSDLSHWMVVVDRIPHDIADLFEEASRRSGHLHARIGHEKGPQVPEPSDPHWAEHVQLHRHWWQLSVDAAEARGEVLTGCSEFGPPPYMNAAPFTQQPVADIVMLNNWMRDRLVEWFS